MNAMNLDILLGSHTGFHLLCNMEVVIFGCREWVLYTNCVHVQICASYVHMNTFTNKSWFINNFHAKMTCFVNLQKIAETDSKVKLLLIWTLINLFVRSSSVCVWIRVIHTIVFGWEPLSPPTGKTMLHAESVIEISPTHLDMQNKKILESEVFHCLYHSSCTS